MTDPIPPAASGCDHCAVLRKEVVFWRDQQKLAASVAADLAGLNDYDGRLELLRRKLAEAEGRRITAEEEADTLALRLQQIEDATRSKE